MKPRPTRDTWFPALIVTLSWLGASAVRAAEVPCVTSEADVAVVDGLLSDWSSVKGYETSSGPPGDAAMNVRCNVDPRVLTVAIDVRDERLVRTAAAGRGDDRLVLVFGETRLTVFPASDDVAHKIVWTGKGKLDVADSLQPKGWSVEVAIPLSRLPGWAKNVPAIPFRAEFHDVDMLAEGRVQAVVATARSGEEGRMLFGEGDATFRAFLSQMKLGRKDLILDVMSNMDRAAGSERVVAGGRVVGILSDEYTYLQLPAARKQDVLEVKVLDLAGEGKSSILVRYVERGGGGSREVLAVYNVLGDGSIARTFAHEIGKTMGPARLTNTWELVPRKAPRKKRSKAGAGMDLVIRPGTAVGVSEQTWREMPASDLTPILLPWDERKQEVWSFSGDEVSGG